MASKSQVSRFLSTLAIAGCLASGFTPVVLAQGLPGLTIFSGVARENQLGYRLDFNGRPGFIDRYRLRIPRRKMDAAVSEIRITYPQTYRGSFDTRRIQVKVNGNVVEIEQPTWDRENREIMIYPREPIPADTRVEIVLSNVRNPDNGGTHYFNVQVQSPGAVPLMRYLGTWIISIGNS
ncbi:MAG TPA: DUF2808 domain-containing protein [Synechococcales cyanobacterium M55_K2018_004]|nr:DUF2808 domain-containing protein [Synechococcales cyanobacterium M55_K2018_004]